MSIDNPRAALFSALEELSDRLDPHLHTESVAYLVQRALDTPRYSFRLVGPRPSSPDLLTDLATSTWAWTELKSASESPEELGSVRGLAPTNDIDVEGSLIRVLVSKLSVLDSNRVDQLAGLIFVRDLLASTGRLTTDRDVFDKFEATTGMAPSSDEELTSSFQELATALPQREVLDRSDPAPAG